MKTHLSLFALLGAMSIVSTLSGCAVTMNMPAVRFESPEAQGELGKGYAGIGVATANELTIVPFATTGSPTDQRSFDQTVDLPLLAGVGLIDGLDAEIRMLGAGGGTGVPLISAKYQFLGEPRVRSEAGNFSMSAMLGGGFANHSETDTDVFTSTANVDSHYWALDSAIIAGYRVNKSFLVYGGPFYTHYGFHGTVTSNSSPFNFAGNADQTGVNVGCNLGSRLVQFKLEVAYAYANSGGANANTLNGGAMLNFVW